MNFSKCVILQKDRQNQIVQKIPIGTDRDRQGSGIE